MPLVNRTIGVRMSILAGGPNGTPVYTETHSTVTDDLGLFTVTIGEGSAVTGNFASINWGSGQHWLAVAIDMKEGRGFVDLGRQQLASVPYALYSQRSRRADTALVAVRTLEPSGVGNDSLAWGVRGNTGINPNENFLGTKDSAALVFRTDDVERMRVAGDGAVSVQSLRGSGGRIVLADSLGRLSARRLSELIDPEVVGIIGNALNGDTTFVNRFVRRINTILSHDSVFINQLTRDSLFISRVGNGSSDSLIARRLLRDSVFIRSLVEYLDSRSRRDTIVIRDSMSVGLIINQFDTLLAHDTDFVLAFTRDSLFLRQLKVIGDSSYWALTGSAGTDPSRNFLGTTDNAALALRTNNTERVRVTETGNVGVGTPTPGERLHVAGNIRADGLAGDGDRLVVTDATGRLRADADVSQILVRQVDTVLARDSAFVTNLINNDYFITNINGLRDSSFWSLFGSAGTNPSRNFLGTTDNADLAFRTNNAERVRVTATGNVGVGTANPATKLDVAGAIRSDSLAGAGSRIMVATPDGRATASTNVAGIIIPQIDTLLARNENFITELTNNNTFITNINGLVDSTSWSLNGNAGTNPSTDFLGTTDNAALALRTNNTERVRVTGNGNVGVGTTAPATKLDVAGAIRSDSLVGTGNRLMVAGPDGRINASTNVSGLIVPQIDTVLARDPEFISTLTNNNTFVTALTGNNTFVSNVRAIGDSSFWSLFGSAGTDPSRNFLGTTDNAALAFRTNNTERVRVTATGNVGVGTANPATKLDVAGAIRSDSLAGAGSRIMVATPDGRATASTNVAGIIIPQIDTLLARNENFITELTNNNTFITNINGLVDSTSWSLNGNAGTNPSTDFLGTTDNAALALRTNNAERVRVTATGNVGVGTTTPATKLDVAGAIRSDSLVGTGNRLMVAGPDGRINASTNVSGILVPQIDTVLARDPEFISTLANNNTFVTTLTANNTFATNVRAIGDSSFWSLFGSRGTDPSRNFLGTTDNAALALRTNNTERVRVTATGNVGVGTMTPATKLDVAGAIRSDSLVGAGNRIMVAGPDGRIGASTNVAGIIVPQIDTVLARDENFITELTNNNTFINNVSAIADSTSWSLTGSAGTDPSRNFLGTTDNAALALRTNNAERVRVTATGNVGVGTTTPATKLDVAGAIRSDSLVGTGNRLMVAGPDGRINASTNVSGILVPQIDTVLARDPEFISTLANNNTFVTTLTANNTFATNVRAIGDSSFWSLFGSRGTDPSRNFLGTTDNAALAFRTNNTERVRVTESGSVGIGTATPGERLHVAGNILADGLAGAGNRIMVAGPDGRINASTNVAGIIVPQIDTVLARDPEFISTLTNNNTFINSVSAIADSTSWSLTGSAGTDPSRNFLGTTDNAALALRTNNTERVRVTATGNVGVGTTTPATKLDVAGAIRSDSLAGAGTRLLVAGADGRIVASTNVSGIIVPQIDTVLARDPAFITTLTNNNTFVTNVRAIGDSAFWSLTGSRGTNPSQNFLGTTDNAALAFRTNNTERVRVTATGNVGVGTTAPATKLDVAGAIRSDSLVGLTNRIMVATPDGRVTASSNVASIIIPQIDTILARSPLFAAELTLNIGLLTRLRAAYDTTYWSLTGTAGTNPSRNFLGTTDNAALALRTNNTERVRVTATGNVGVGTTTPATKLDVAGAIRSDSLVGTGNRLMVAGPDGRIGASTNVAGIIVPQIDTVLARDPEFISTLTNNNTFINSVSAIADSTSWSLTGSAGTDPSRNFLGTTDNAALALRTNNAERVRVTATGNVGVGTTTPATKLDVAGAIRSDSLAGVGSRIMVAGADGRIGASTNVAGIIVPQIDTVLARDENFITELTNNNTFIENVRSVADSTSWSLTGSAGTDPSRNFLGTTDNAALALRTNNAERVRVTATGNVGVGTTTPATKLDVAGAIRSDSLAGVGSRIMVAGPDGRIGASTNVSGIIVPQIDTVLARDENFITELTNNNTFIDNVRSVADSTSWSLTGSAGTDPSRNFLGTTDNAALALRTNNAERVRVTATGNVGVGTTTPATKLDVAGAIRSDSLAGVGSRIMVAGPDGRIGASTNVAGIIVPQIDTVLARDPAFITTLTANNTFVTNVRAIGDSSFWSLTGSAGTNPAQNFLGTTDNVALALRTNNVERVRVTAAGNVGIGTGTPGARLHVAGAIRSDSLAGAGNRLIVAGADGLINASTNVSGIIVPQVDTALARSLNFVTELTNNSEFINRLPARTGDSTRWSLTGNAGTNPALNFLGTTDAVALSLRTANTERVHVTATGNVGVGTATPGERLHVAGNILADGLAGSGNRLIVAGADGRINASTNVSGIIVPQVDTALARSLNFVTELTNNSEFINRLPARTGDSTRWSLFGNAGTNPSLNFLGTTDAVALSLRTANTERVHVTATGNVGVGTATPGERLHVAGNILADGLAGSGNRLMVAGADGRITASSNVSGLLLPQVDTALARSLNFVTTLTSNPAFISRLPGSVGDSTRWSLFGNTGTNPAQNFLGTTDAVGLSLRTSNVERLRVTAAGNIGIGTTTPSERLHVAGNILVDGLAGTGLRLTVADATGRLNVSSNVSSILLPQVDTALARSLNFVTELTSNPTFISRLAGRVGDTTRWSLLGNAGTNPSLNFLGTTDNVGLAIRTNNVERLRIGADGSIGIGSTSATNRLEVVNDIIGDERAGVRGVTSQNVATQSIGVWGDAEGTGSGNTGSIGVLATGNGNTAAASVNTALQIADGGINVGRTTQTGVGYTVVEGATAGVSYTAEGPSGVIEVPNLANLLGLLGIGQNVILNRIQVNNRYVTPNSIILVQVIDASGLTIGGLLNMTYSSLVDDRGNGTFRLSVSAHYAGLLPLTLGSTDGIRIGYMVVNPSK